ncbi:hypothetical protein FRC02_007552 [Tulasnella sp. 418]|nr:hypothetical protein FRC02_007552 [Tulasnella sp. 418]
MATNTWPQPLKDWVTKCLQQINLLPEPIKSEAQAELKDKIANAYAKKTMWTIDWSTQELECMKPKTAKRKVGVDTTGNPIKKTKKSTLAASLLSSETDDRLQQRARRFEREHEIERQKQSGQHQSPASYYSRHVNQAPPQSSLESRMSGLTTSFSFTPRPVKGQARRKYMNSSMGYDESEDVADPNVIDWDRYTIVGKSTNLFKNYLRLTSEPDPRDIRPYHILQQTLTELKRKWKEDAKYPWICDQFKSLRQDLTVQRIKNEFTVQVYEIHARMALESADLVEYNQCQSALRHLYELGIPGKSEEFLAYRILYMLHTRNRSDLNRLMSSLTPQIKANPAVKHALDVQAALATNNYHAFFRLFMNAPNMGAYIMDHFVERERIAALCVMSKAYLSLPLSFIANELAFDTPTDAHTFLFNNGAAQYVVPKNGGSGGSIADGTKMIDCKAAHKPLLTTSEKFARRVNIKGAI